MADGETLKRTVALAGHKLYSDYTAIVKNVGSVEPESFYDTWIKRFVIRATPEFMVGVWKYFLSELIQARGKRQWQ